MWAVVDPESCRENPVEDKHRRLVRSHRSSPYDRELKPNAKIRDELGVSLKHGDILSEETPFVTSYLLGNPQLLAFPTPHVRGKGPYMEIPVLSGTG
jgi:hypothetical protein